MLSLKLEGQRGWTGWACGGRPSPRLPASSQGTHQASSPSPGSWGPTQPTRGWAPECPLGGLPPADHAVSGIGPVEMSDHKVLAPHHGARVGRDLQAEIPDVHAAAGQAKAGRVAGTWPALVSAALGAAQLGTWSRGRGGPCGTGCPPCSPREPLTSSPRRKLAGNGADHHRDTAETRRARSRGRRGGGGAGG